MIDPKLLRNQPEFVAERLAIRGFKLNTAWLIEQEAARKQLQKETDELKNRRNVLSKEIGRKKAQGENVESVMAEVAGLGDSLKTCETELEKIQSGLQNYLLTLPNIPHESVPLGKSEDDNLEIRRVGTPRVFEFQPKDHVDLGTALGGMDFETGAKVTGARFVFLKGSIARLHRALAQFMLDMHVDKHGYEELNVPYLVNQQSIYGTGQYPKSLEDMFQTKNGDKDLWLIPTAEVPVTNLARDEIYKETDLPRKYVAYSACFRSEAGSYGKDTRGMIRQHQFEKVELVMLALPSQSYALLETLTSHAEAVLQALDLPYRVVTLCGGDLGAISAKTYDIEVWLPGQNRYREISSCSIFEDFHARRMQARYRDADGNIHLIHTLNGSGLAVGRTLVAVLENYQNANGSITIPECLRPYMGGQAEICSAPL